MKSQDQYNDWSPSYVKLHLAAFNKNTGTNFLTAGSLLWDQGGETRIN